MSFPSVIQGNEGDQFGDHVTRLFGLGQKMELPDGRIYRYALMGGVAGVANKLYQASLPVAHNAATALTVAMTLGDNFMTFEDGGTEPVNMEEGSIIAEETDDLGGLYRIWKANTGTTTSQVWFYPDVTIQTTVAVAGFNVSTFCPNPWAGILIHASVPTAQIVGIPASIIAAADWGWVCTMGVCSCLIDATTASPVIGGEVRPSEDDDGAVALQDYSEVNDADLGSCGRVLEVAPDGDFGLIYLRVE